VNSLKKNLIKKLFGTVVSLYSLIVFKFIHAQTVTPIPCPPGLRCPGPGESTLNGFIVTIIGWLLSISGAIAILFVIIGGFRYITSAGNEESAEAGKKTVINAIIGIVVIILSYVIVNVISNTVSGVVAP
jgi:hypothetical protein